MFSWIDLIAPIGIAVVAVALAIWTSRTKSTPIEGRIISAITALIFVLGVPALYVVRASSLKHDYITAYQVKIKDGSYTQCSTALTSEWVEWTVDFWSKRCDQSKFIKQLSDFFMVCVDEEKLSAANRHVRGYTRGSVGVVGYNGKPGYTESLFKHELSHFIWHMCGAPWNEKEHHLIFAKEGLGY